MSDTRIEKDSLGPVEVPANAYSAHRPSVRVATFRFRGCVSRAASSPRWG